MSDLVVVRVAYDFLIFKELYLTHESMCAQWVDLLNSTEMTAYEQDEFFGILYTWHLALELSYQRHVAHRSQRFRQSSNSRLGTGWYFVSMFAPK